MGSWHERVDVEVAVPVTQANKLLKRVRELFDESAAEGCNLDISKVRQYSSRISILVASGLIWVIFFLSVVST